MLIVSSAPGTSDSKLLTDIFLQVARRVDGAALVREALVGGQGPGFDGHPPAVLALGKVAFPMFEGLLSVTGGAPARGLVIAPETRFPRELHLPPFVEARVADHPEPSTRSVQAGNHALAFASSLTEDDHLIVLVSGGGSALMVAPAGDLTLDEKRATTRAVARAGATIAELNCVRKHLSALKGGQLAVATRAPTTVLALSDVVGNDPSTIASGPWSPDPTTFAQALDLVDRLAPQAPARARAHLARGAAGDLPETPKPGAPRLRHVSFTVLAGPERVTDEARTAVVASKRIPGTLSRNTEIPVPELAASYAERARHEATSGGQARILIGNGEPSIVVTGSGRGGRATHLALLMAREIAGLPGVSFLAAGTDDRDGSSSASGAVVDGTTWARAQAAGLDPTGALERCDSETPLAALGALVRGPGTSNLLDLHLLSIQPSGAPVGAP